MLALLIVARFIPAAFQVNIAYVYLGRGVTGEPEAIDHARTIFATLYEETPSNTLRYEMCRSYLFVGDIENASLMCRNLELQNMRTMIDVGDVAQTVFGRERAQDVYELIHELYPNSPIVYHRLGKIYPLGTEADVKAMLTALELNREANEKLAMSEEHEAHLHLAQVYIWWTAYTKALEHVTSALKLIPTMRGYRLKAQALMRLERYQEAQATIDEGLSNPDNYQVYLESAELRRIEGDYSGAIADYNRYLAAAPDNEKVWGLEPLCKLYLELQDGQDAIDQCSALLAQVPTNPSFHILFGDAAMLVTNYILAEQAYLDALALDATNEVAESRLADIRTQQNSVYER